MINSSAKLVRRTTCGAGKTGSARNVETSLMAVKCAETMSVIHVKASLSLLLTEMLAWNHF
jgi:hypothetical protein